MPSVTPTPAAPAAPRSAAEIEAELATISDPIDPPDDAPAEPTPAPDAAAVAATLAAETAATQKGWVPKDQYKGDPAKWVDAKTFIERGERFNKNLQKEVEALKKQIAEFEGTKKAFAKFHEETVAKKDAEIKSAIAALRVQRSEAQADGDHEGAVAIEDRIDLLKEEQASLKQAAKDAPAAAPPASNGPNPTDPVLMEWIEDGNKWFNEDTQLRDYSVAIGENLIKSGTTLRGRKFLDEVRRIVEENFPRRFKAPAAAPRASGAEGASSTRTSSNSGGRTEADLPPEDRALMKQFIKEGWTTKEKFLSGYFSR